MVQGWWCIKLHELLMSSYARVCGEWLVLFPLLCSCLHLINFKLDLRIWKKECLQPTECMVIMCLQQTEKWSVKIPLSDSEAQKLEVVPLASMTSQKPFRQKGICERASGFKGREGPKNENSLAERCKYSIWVRLLGDQRTLPTWRRSRLNPNPKKAILAWSVSKLFNFGPCIEPGRHCRCALAIERHKLRHRGDCRKS